MSRSYDVIPGKLSEVPYDLHQLCIDIQNGYEIAITDSEDKAAHLHKWEIPATSIPSITCLNTHIGLFRDADIMLLPNNTPQGREKADKIGTLLTGVARRVRVLNLPELNGGGDTHDWFANGHTYEEFVELWKKARRWQPNGADHGITQDAKGALRQEADATTANDGLIGHFHGDADFEQEHNFLVYNTIPRIGGGLLAGQWGTYKTFIVNDLAATLIMATADDSQLFCGEEIDYPGAVLVYFSEGESEASIRIDGALDNRGWPKGKPAPYVYLTSEDLPLNLSNTGSVSAFIAKIKLLSAEMERRFSFPIVASFIDTIGPVSGYAKSGDEKDEVPARIVNMALRRIGTETESFCFGVEHFGKSVETGVLGSSSKEATAYCVLAALGDKDITGKVTDPRLAVRMAKGGVAGREYPFTVKLWESGKLDKKGRERKTLCIEWTNAPKSGATRVKVSKRQRHALEVLAETLLAHSQTAPAELKLSAGLQVVTADQWRTELTRKRVIDPKGKNPTARFNEIREALNERKLIGVWDEFVWLPKPQP